MPSRWDPTTINRLVQSEFHICTLKSYFIDPPSLSSPISGLVVLGENLPKMMVMRKKNHGALTTIVKKLPAFFPCPKAMVLSSTTLLNY